MTLAPKSALPFLQKQLPPAIAVDEKLVARIIRDLDSARFAVREKAAEELTGLDEFAVPALKKALAGNPSAESRRRIDQALAKLQGPVTSLKQVRALRSLEVLEHIGTPDARKVLETLAKGAPEALADAGSKSRAWIGCRAGPNDPLRQWRAAGLVPAV